MRVLAVDPGREKCGIAVCSPEGIIAHRVVRLGDLREAARGFIQAHGVRVVIVGDQTGSQQVLAIMSQLAARVERVPERGSTLEARRRYFRDHPPTGWRRLVPLSLQVPREPYDDYTAIVLAEAYLSRTTPEGRSPFSSNFPSD